MKQHIDTGVVGSPGRFARPGRVCQFEGCEAPAKGYKYCADHAKEAKKQNHRESERKRHAKERATQKAQKAVAKRQNDDRLKAIAKEPKHLTAADIMRNQPEKAADLINKILNGERGYVGA